MFQILIKLNISFGALGFGLEGANGIFGSIRDWEGVWGGVVSGDSVSKMLSGLIFVSGMCWIFSGISLLLTCFFPSFSTL